ncbi:unnamed protein product, partial [Scytosiphon promiscuus]
QPRSARAIHPRARARTGLRDADSAAPVSLPPVSLSLGLSPGSGPGTLKMDGARPMTQEDNSQNPAHPRTSAAPRSSSGGSSSSGGGGDGGGVHSQGMIAQSPPFMSSGGQVFMAPQSHDTIQIAAPAAEVAPTAPVPSGGMPPFYPHHGTHISLPGTLSGGNNSNNNSNSNSNSNSNNGVGSMAGSSRNDDSALRLYHAASDSGARGMSRATPTQTAAEKQATVAAAAAAAAAAGVAAAVTGGWFIGEPGDG